ncbi:acyl dehydratase (plasmid) [Bosea sp. F3-2]|uniref:MaoC family dehydratase n=1 Tax=Bosea sp. F3-2 TaxID=2599640 RepID=UPI0011EBFA82|nr:MaoC family dehydratase [Bosea sp. F3-2]QEL27404.1 acyl dehydratase [Bosea sp. F3-2]
MTTADTGQSAAPATGAQEWRPPFIIGQALEAPIVFTPDSVRTFATLTNDTNPLHHDAALASTTRFGGLIASGTQTTGLLLGSLANHIFPENASLGLGCSFRLRKAVPADAALIARWTVRSIVPKPSLNGVLVELDGGLVDQKGTVFVEASATIAVMPHEALNQARPT